MEYSLVLGKGFWKLKKKITDLSNLSLMRRHLKGRFKQRANNVQGDKIKVPLKYMKGYVKRGDELFIRFYQGSSNS